MKWDNENTAKLKELVYAGKSNKEIAQIMEIKVNDVYNKRSQLGITMDKIKDLAPAPMGKENLRTRDEVLDEIGKVINSKKAAEKKILRCDKRLGELSEELQLARVIKGEVK